MAMHIPKAPGEAQMLKDDTRYLLGLEEEIYRNTTNFDRFYNDLSASLFGLNNDDDDNNNNNNNNKPFVTNDAVSIANELLLLASQMQEIEAGDGYHTNFVTIFAGELLHAVKGLLCLGITTSEIIEGYENVLNKALEILPTLVVHEVKDIRDEEQVKKGIRNTIMSKQYGNKDLLASYH